MSLWRQLTRGIRKLWKRNVTDQETADEVNHYLDEATAAYLAKGLALDQARRAARVDLGSTTAARELVRAYGWENTIDNLFSNLRYALRGLARNPGFTAVGVLTLGLGVGASTAIFSVVDAVLLRALPYPAPDNIVRIWEQAPDGHRMNLADLNFDDFEAQNKTFKAMAVYEFSLASVAGGSEPVRVNGAAVSKSFFKVMGVEPWFGRAFATEEQRVHGAPAAIISYSYWQKYLGGVKDLSKTRLKMEGGVYPVVGVMPEGFDFPAGTAVWVPRELDMEGTSRTAHNWRGIGRIRDGITIGQARENLREIAHRINMQYGKAVDLNDAAVMTLAEATVGDVRTALLTLLAASGLLLLVACANVAGLLVARTSARSKELAVRSALGAGRGRLVQQFLTESFCLASAGGLLGVLLAAWSIKVLPAILPANLPRQQGIAINTSVLLFDLALISLVAVSLGLFAAWRAGRGDLQEALASGSRSYSGTAASGHLRSLVVVGEIAMTLVILVGAGLLGRSFLRLIETNPGFNTQNLIAMQFSPPNPAGQAFAMDQAAILRQARLMEDILARLRSIPGVGTVGLAGALPVAAGDNLADGTFLVLNGNKSPASFDEWGMMAQNPANTGHALYAVASAEYFRTVGIPLIRGRMFGSQDVWNSPHVALISQSLARERWPNQDPIGQVINFGNMDGNIKPLTIIGVAGDVRTRGLDLPPGTVIYVDYRQRGLNVNSSPVILMRGNQTLQGIVHAARGIFQDLAPDSPVTFSTFADEMGSWWSDRRFLLLIVGLFAAVALTLAAVGIYGVVAFSVARRTQEIGIRMALGAEQSSVMRLILVEGARLAAIGVVMGISVSLLMTRFLSSLLFGVSALDPLTLAGVAVLLSLVALLASYVPARRAMRLDPTTALRVE